MPGIIYTMDELEHQYLTPKDKVSALLISYKY